MSEKLGFVGLGNMGLPIAIRLLEAGYAVVGCDTRESQKAPFTAKGGNWAGTPAEVAAQCEIVMVSLPTPASVEQVALGKNGLAEGAKIKIYVDLSTTGPTAARKVAELLGKRHIVAMDAPVSGGVAGAAKGTLSVMVSGPKPAFERVRTMMTAFGKPPFYVGEEAGQGQLMKLINNLLSATTLAASCEALSLGIKGGLNPETMLTVLNSSTGKSGATEDKIPRYILPGRPIDFNLGLSFKDVSLAVQAGEEMSVPMAMGRATWQIWQHAVCKGGADQDMMDVAKCIEAWAKVKLYGSCAD